MNERVVSYGSSKEPKSCSNFYIDFYGTGERLRQFFPSVNILPYYDYGLDRFMRNGVYAEPYSNGARDHFQMRVIGRCPHLKPFGQYRGKGGFECECPNIPSFCKNKFQKSSG